MADFEAQESMDGIAIVGMAGRFPGAKNVKEFWDNICNGIESIKFFSDEELLKKNIDPALLDNPDYVKAGGVLDGIEMFDAKFFGYNPREAEIMNPQHRFFLECAWTALEDAGYDPENYDGRIGVYAGEGPNMYLLNIFSNTELVQKMNGQQVVISNDKDFLATQVSYKLNLKGPSVSIQTACSTSLVAVSLACQGLLDYKCDMVLAGGVTIFLEQNGGYIYEEGGINSPDGHCRPFDAKAKGTVAGSGAAIVVLKRLEDALADGDHIYAVIKGTAINNDGSLKVGYTAPSVDGQAEVIAEAMALAEVEPESIGYVETHGTGTTLGDPIEIAALTEAFSEGTDKKAFCAIGSVKANVGHLDTAAGATGLIKAALALKNRVIPPSLHFEQPNPKIDFANSPFFVNTKLQEWKTTDTHRYAGVSSFGIGGTNAHAVLEEPPEIESDPVQRSLNLLVLSAKTNTALEKASENLANFLKESPNANLADIAYTLQVGRQGFNHRRAVVCKDIQDAVDSLEGRNPERLFTGYAETSSDEVVFMFPGQGSQYVNMGRGLYENEALFQEQVDICCEILESHLGFDLREILYPADESQIEKATEQLTKTAITQPAIFVIEYALAKLWMEWGLKPVGMIGHSVGEYVAACIAGVMSLEDALALVAVRAKLMQSLPEGSMLAIPLAEGEIIKLLGDELSLAAVNGPSLCVVSGKTERIETLQKELADKGVETNLLHTSHAFHSSMMEPILGEFIELFDTIKLSVPTIPFISNLTGTWITKEQATDPAYWGKHLRGTVRFFDGINIMLKEKIAGVMLEAGPGRTLSTLVKRFIEKDSAVSILASTRHPKDKISDIVHLHNTLGRLWIAGCKIDWNAYYDSEKRIRVSLPTYPFEGKRYWIDYQDQPAIKPLSGKRANIADWFYMPCWKPSVLPLSDLSGKKMCWLIFADEFGLGIRLEEQLRSLEQDVIIVKYGKKFSKNNEAFSINPTHKDDYVKLVEELIKSDKCPDRIVHLWCIADQMEIDSRTEFAEEILERGFYSLIYLTQALNENNIDSSLQICAVTNGMQAVNGEIPLYPEKATILGPCRIIPKEYANIKCFSIDINLPRKDSRQEKEMLERIISEFAAASSENIIAYRNNQRLVQTFESTKLEAKDKDMKLLCDEGVYLITGGLGGVGLVFAEWLAKSVKAKIALIGRSEFPARGEWNAWLNSHESNDSVSQKIKKLKDIEKLGAEVIILKADITNYEQTKDAINGIIDKFGRLNGVIHAAGAPGGGVIALKTREKAEAVLAPKIKGTLVLDALLKNMSLDFLVFCSSINSVINTTGQVDYTAANAFLDAFAAHNVTANNYTLSINWDTWQETGMAVNTIIPKQLEEVRREELKNGLLSQEAIDAFERILSYGISPQVVICTQDLLDIIKNNISSEEQESENQDDNQALKTSYERPQLSNAYIAPENETQEKLAQIWQELLGIEQIGIHDNFFELGGHSLLATQLISRIRAVLKVSFSMQNFFEIPTVAQMAKAIDEKNEQENELENLLSQIEDLSEVELLKALEEAAVGEE